MNDDDIRRRLMTTLSAAVRIGRSPGLTDSQVAAELHDLVDLYLAAVPPTRTLFADFGNGPQGLTIKLDNPLLRKQQAEMWATTVDTWQADKTPRPEEPDVPQDSAVAPQCGFQTPAYNGDGAVDHDHWCQKTPGHADGPSGSDHQCESCGVLFDASGGTASPLGMVGLPLGGNGPVDEPQEIEL